MEDIRYQGKTLTFFELINGQKIEIPIIQRDYAQGRIDKKEIRLTFLDALFQSLSSNKPIKLDFIYGSMVDDRFQPLDGQQRLTTLFLLHWYAAMKDKISDYDYKSLANFSYEIRISSRDFCKELIYNPIELNLDSPNLLSERIINSSWFYLSWKKDPTIDAMLRTIDDIHGIFHGVDNLWARLTANDSPISFYYVELENMGLTDDLYIKMNARGKLLSHFENFKAGLQKLINNNKWEESTNIVESFALKMDTIWTDLFWKNFKSYNNIDNAFIRFIAAIAMIQQSVEKSTDRIVHITRLQDKPNTVRPELFSKDGFIYLKECFDIYTKVYNENINLDLDFPLWRHKPRKNLMSEVSQEYNIFAQTNSASYTQKVLFYAQTEYLRRVDNFIPPNFQDWMRVIRNIVSRGSIDIGGKRPDIIRSPQSFDGVINLINELSEGCDDIYGFLSSKDKFISAFAKDQIEEERIKAKIIISNPDAKNIIFGAEDTTLLMGRIDFIFYCMDFDKNISSFDLEHFAAIGKVISDNFDSEYDNLSNDLRRALLTIEVGGNYEFYKYWWSFWNIGNAHKRCLLENFRELEYYIYSEYRLYFKKLVLLLKDKTISQIIDDFVLPSNMPNWKSRLIKEKELLDRSKSNYIAIPDDESYCFLLKSKRPRDLDGCIKVD